MKKIKNIAPNKHFIQGATTLIDNIKSPAAFLQFITEAMSWGEYYARESKKENTTNFFLVVMIESVAQPWFSGGDKVTENIASGLFKVYDAFGYEDYDNHVADIVQGFGIDIKESFCNPDWKEKQLLAISTLFKVGSSIEAYDRLRKQQKLTKAA